MKRFGLNPTSYRLLSLLVLLAFCIWFSSDLIFLKQGFYHTDFATYYFPYRHWFTQQLALGRFPIWNPFFGVGTTAHIWSTFPMDIYSLIELLIGPKYHILLGIQSIFLVMSGYLAFRWCGFSAAVATFGILVAFVSPWVTHYFFYFINTNTFISYLSIFALMNQWFERRRTSSLFGIFFVTVFSFFGTKPEYWFAQNSTLAFLALVGGLNQVRLERTRQCGFSSIGLPLLFLGLGVVANAWQWNLILRIVRLSERGIPSSLSHLFSWPLYENLALSICESTFWALFGSGAFIYLGTILLRKWNAKFATRLIYLLCSALLFRLVFKKQPDLLGLESWALSGSIIGLAIVVLKSFLEARGRGAREELVADLTRLLFLLAPFLYYLGRAGGTYLGEVEMILASPHVFKGLLGVLLPLGLTQIRASRPVLLAFAAVCFVLIMREQGQIILSHVAGILWYPVRDNFIIDFSIAVIAAAGLQSLYQLGSGFFRDHVVNGLAFLCSLVIVTSPFYSLPAEYTHPFTTKHNRLYYSNYLVMEAVGDYPFFEGIKVIREMARAFPGNSPTRVMNLPNDFTYTFGNESFLLEGVGQVVAWESLVPKNYVEWSKYKNFGIRPGTRWWGYPGAYTDKVTKRLPPPNMLNFDANTTYLATLMAKPPLGRDTLRLLGVEYIANLVPDPQFHSKQKSFMEEVAPLKPEWTKTLENMLYPLDAYGILNHTFHLAKISSPFPRSFLISNTSAPDLAAELDPVGSDRNDEITIKDQRHPVTPASIANYDSEKVEIVYDSKEAAHLVLTDLYHPFWTAQMDGVDTKIVPAFHIFRAVEAPAGAHKVLFTCRVPLMKACVLLSVALVLLLTALYFSSIRRRLDKWLATLP